MAGFGILHPVAGAPVDAGRGCSGYAQPTGLLISVSRNGVDGSRGVHWEVSHPHVDRRHDGLRGSEAGSVFNAVAEAAGSQQLSSG